MKVPPSEIISFITGRLYSDKPPTMLVGPIAAAMTGYAPQTMELPSVTMELSPELLKMCPPALQQIIKTWEHSPDWRERLKVIDAEIGEVLVTSL